ncbi:hypothetical protein T492DRAFT_530754 [Pavlovales sp. CCMP2436]|nr:hypothetical protein T492DRAFT_530754 [Pavlovales sp. CCMP2436]
MAKAKALPKPARRAAKPAQTLKPTQEEEPLPPPPYELTRSPSSAVYGLSVGGILSTVVNVLVLGCALFAVVRAPAGREFLARADISMRWSTVSLGVRDGHDFSWRRPAQLAVRAALTATIGLPIAIACGGDPLAHLETYARAAEGDVYPFRDGIAISSHAIITEIVGGADQPRRPMVLAHPLLVADPIARECMRRDTLIFLATGATHSAVRRAVHQAVPGFSWSGPSPELLVAGNNASGCAGEQGGGVCPEGSVGGSCEQGEQGGAGCPAGSARAFLAAAAGEPIDANKVRAPQPPPLPLSSVLQPSSPA